MQKEYIEKLFEIKENIVNEASKEVSPQPTKIDSKFLSTIRNFLLFFRKGLLKGKIENLDKLPSNIKNTAKKITVDKFVNSIPPDDRMKTKQINDKYFSKITTNKYFSYLLSYMAIFKAKLTKTKPEIQVQKMMTQYKKYSRTQQISLISVCLVIIVSLWLIIYYSTSNKMFSPKLNIPGHNIDFFKKMYDATGIKQNYVITIPIVTLLIVTFVAGLYFANKENAPEPEGDIDIEQEKENRRRERVPKPDPTKPFIL